MEGVRFLATLPFFFVLTDGWDVEMFADVLEGPFQVVVQLFDVLSYGEGTCIFLKG